MNGQAYTLQLEWLLRYQAREIAIMPESSQSLRMVVASRVACLDMDEMTVSPAALVDLLRRRARSLALVMRQEPQEN
jgi:hypothetical protein